MQFLPTFFPFGRLHWLSEKGPKAELKTRFCILWYYDSITVSKFIDVGAGVGAGCNRGQAPSKNFENGLGPPRRPPPPQMSPPKILSVPRFVPPNPILKTFLRQYAWYPGTLQYVCLRACNTRGVQEIRGKVLLHKIWLLVFKTICHKFT